MKPFIVTIDYPVRAYREYIVKGVKTKEEALRLVESGEVDEDYCVTNRVKVDYTSPKFSVKVYKGE